MRILLDNTLLASPSLTGAPAFGVTLNGRQIVQETDFVRAAVGTLYARGNRTTELAFSTTRLFGSLRRAQKFALTHAASLPTEGAVVVTCGEGADTETVVLEGAVLERAEIVAQIGSAVVVRYLLRGPDAWSSDIPEDLEGETEAGEDTLVMRRGKVSLASGATSATITFSAVLSTTPAAVSATLSRPTGEPLIGCAVREDTISTSGFTVDLDAPTPSANYKLHYHAFE